MSGSTHELGEIAYAAYGSAVGGTAYNGDQLKAWAELDPPRQDAWRQASEAVADSVKAGAAAALIALVPPMKQMGALREIGRALGLTCPDTVAKPNFDAAAGTDQTANPACTGTTACAQSTDQAPADSTDAAPAATDQAPADSADAATPAADAEPETAPADTTDAPPAEVPAQAASPEDASAHEPAAADVPAQTSGLPLAGAQTCDGGTCPA